MCCSTDFEENFNKLYKLKNRQGQFFHSDHDYGSQTKNNAYLSK